VDNVTITDADREAYLAFNNMPQGIAQAVRDGKYDKLTGMQIIACHRLLGHREGLEMAAKVVKVTSNRDLSTAATVKAIRALKPV